MLIKNPLVKIVCWGMNNPCQACRIVCRALLEVMAKLMRMDMPFVKNAQTTIIATRSPKPLAKLVQLEEFQTLVPFRVRCVLRVGKLMDWVVLVACPVHINQGWKNQIVLIVSEWVVFVFVVVVVHFSDVIFNVIVRCSPF